MFKWCAAILSFLGMLALLSLFSVSLAEQSEAKWVWTKSQTSGDISDHKVKYSVPAKYENANFKDLVLLGASYIVKPEAARNTHVLNFYRIADMTSGALQVLLETGSNSRSPKVAFARPNSLLDGKKDGFIAAPVKWNKELADVLREAKASNNTEVIDRVAQQVLSSSARQRAEIPRYINVEHGGMASIQDSYILANPQNESDIYIGISSTLANVDVVGTKGIVSHMPWPVDPDESLESKNLKVLEE